MNDGSSTLADHCGAPKVSASRHLARVQLGRTTMMTIRFEGGDK